jgi:hypothetical protein
VADRYVVLGTLSPLLIDDTPILRTDRIPNSISWTPDRDIGLSIPVEITYIKKHELLDAMVTSISHVDIA